VEGLAGPPPSGAADPSRGEGHLHRVQRAFLDRDAYQCGYCTPGQICSAVAVLAEADAGWPSAVTPAGSAGPAGAAALDADEVRERMSGNLCRCGAYANIVPAVLDAAGAAHSGDTTAGTSASAAGGAR
jgi:xanthine dehydrogenase YagT iron-sulfur-binding subunit